MGPGSELIRNPTASEPYTGFLLRDLIQVTIFNNNETMFFAVDPYYGSLNSIP